MANTGDITSLLALDMDAGTQDLLLWRTGEPIENAVKMVLPTPTQGGPARVRTARLDVFLHGWLMDGGALHTAVAEHLAAGLGREGPPERMVIISPLAISTLTWAHTMPT